MNEDSNPFPRGKGFHAQKRPARVHPLFTSWEWLMHHPRTVRGAAAFLAVILLLTMTTVQQSSPNDAQASTRFPGPWGATSSAPDPQPAQEIPVVPDIDMTQVQVPAGTGHP